jgi:hypothetical protein
MTAPTEGGDTWEWVRRAIKDYDAETTSRIKGAVVQLRNTLAIANSETSRASNFLQTNAAAVEEERKRACQNVSYGLGDAVDKYPECFTAGSALVLSLGTRFTPRRFAAFAMLSGLFFRAPLTAKWGGSVAASSAAASRALKEQAEVNGLLPKN